MWSIQCFECSGFGHVRTECPNFKNSKGQAMNVSLSEESKSNDSKDTKKNNVRFMAFAAFMNSVVVGSDCDPPVLVKTCDEESMNDLDEGINLQEAYNQFF